MSDHSESGALSFHRRIAAHCNNSAWDLIEREALDAGDCVALVRLAATAAHHWREIGTSDNVANGGAIAGATLVRFSYPLLAALKLRAQSVNANRLGVALWCCRV